MTQRYLTPTDPSTGKNHEPLPVTPEESVQFAVASARAAGRTWCATSVAERGKALRRVADELDAAATEIGTLITKEMGRPLAESIPEVTKSAAFFRYFADIAEEALAPTEIDLKNLTLPQKTAHIRYEARGVAAIIKPWNAPVQQVVWALAPALAAGCGAVVKPSEYTPRSSLLLQAAIDRAGLPTGLVATIPGDANTGAQAVNAGVDLVAFTGSVQTGRKVAGLAGQNLRKCILELSGKDSLIVDKDMPDFDLVVAGIVYGSYSNCGHWCSSVEKVFLPRERFSEMADAIVEGANRLRVGPGLNAGIDMGPVSNSRQLAVVERIVRDAVDLGATVLAGGHTLSIPGHEGGFFYAPTVLTDVPAESSYHTENIFGPVVALYPYDDLDDAVKQANATVYGLGLSLWTNNEETASRVVAQSQTGMIWVNEPLQSIAACPWSVYKDSGYGSELGASGIREYTFEKVVQSQFQANDGPRPWYFPYK
jgi:acyl-CoA reductase-like NAD-dependent aldehyde dehydrogenase